jgi:hypothetical protein
MAENRATFSLRRRFALGFSKRRLSRTAWRVPSRSIFFFNRRNARSTGSPFFNLISVKIIHFLSKRTRAEPPSWQVPLLGRVVKSIFAQKKVNRQRSFQREGGNHGCHLNQSPWGTDSLPNRLHLGPNPASFSHGITWASSDPIRGASRRAQQAALEFSP